MIRTHPQSYNRLASNKNPKFWGYTGCVWKCAGSQDVPLGVLRENTGIYGAMKTVPSPTMFGGDVALAAEGVRIFIRRIEQFGGLLS